MPQRRNRITQSAIAAATGVSISTVSRVLKGAPGISPAVRDQVRQAAKALGYSSSAAASAPRLKAVTLFSTLANLAASNGQFHTDIMAGVEDACRRRGIRLTCTAIDGRGVHERAAVQELAAAGDKGIVFLSVDHGEVVAEALAQGIPTVAINAEHPGVDVDCFLPDNKGGALAAVRHLIAKGHRRILHITHLERPTIRRRFNSYRAALDEAGIPFAPDLLVEVPGNLQAENAYATLKPLLAARAPWFTAAFCANDLLALGVMKALREAAVTVPDQVSVVGFDDLAMAALTDPPLTTIRIARRELGVLAAERLFARAAEPSLVPIRVEIVTPLIERHSVRDLATQGEPAACVAADSASRAARLQAAGL